jgi:cytochrome c oxidase subunit IV
MNAAHGPEHGGAATYAGGLGKFIVVYLCILGLAGLQFLIAYSHLDKSQMFARMALIAIAEAGLGVMFFMHLASERRNFVVCVAVITLFVLAALQYSWTDSYRMELGVPNSQYKTGAVQ